MPDRNDFFGSGARSDWTRQPVTAPRSHLSGGTGLPAASNSYDQQSYGQATYDQSSYDQAQYDQPSYEPTQYQSHADQSSHYDQPQYQQSDYERPQYDQAQYDQSPYGTSYQQPHYDSTAYAADQAGYAATGYAQPQTPAYEQGHDATSFESASFDPAAYRASTHDSATYDPAPAAPVGGFETVAPAEPEPVARPERGTDFGQPGKSALDWTELTGAGNGRQSDGHQESTPIFDALVSAWFRKGSALFSKERKAGKSADQTSDDTANEPETSWPSPADQGWQAADAVAHSKPDGYTTSGLPRRTPSARLLPGSMAGQNAAGRHLDRKPEEMRSRLSDFQRGSHEGRHNTGTKRWTPVWDEEGERESG